MSKPKYVKIEKDGVEGTCLPRSVDMWKRNGWTVVDDEVGVVDEPQGEQKVVADPRDPRAPKQAQERPTRQGSNALTSTDDKN